MSVSIFIYSCSPKIADNLRILIYIQYKQNFDLFSSSSIYSSSSSSYPSYPPPSPHFPTTSTHQLLKGAGFLEVAVKFICVVFAAVKRFALDAGYKGVNVETLAFIEQDVGGLVVNFRFIDFL